MTSTISSENPNIAIRCLRKRLMLNIRGESGGAVD
jgi:hypothetical protein